MTMDILNSGPNRDQPEFERPEWAHDLTPSMTHGEACPIWMWLSDGYVQSAIEKWDYSKDRLRDRYHAKRSKNTLERLPGCFGTDRCRTENVPINPPDVWEKPFGLTTCRMAV